MQQADLLDALASAVRAVYIVERRRLDHVLTGVVSTYGSGALPRWDGVDESAPRRAYDAPSRGDRLGRDLKPYWPKIVRFALANSVSPVELVRARFAYATARPPEPPDCQGPFALDCYQRHCAALPRTLANALAAQKVKVVVRAAWFDAGRLEPMPADELVARLVSEPHVGLSPLFRCAFAAEHGRPDLAEALLPEAVSQYLTSRTVYDEVWGPAVPELVRRVADQLVAAGQYGGRSS